MRSCNGLDGLPVGDVAERLPSAFHGPALYDWRSNGLLESINHHLVMAARELEGRDDDSQSVRTTESGGVRGYDAGKGAASVTSSTLGLLVNAADIQDRDGAPEVLKSIRHRFPRLRHLFADAAYDRGRP